MALDVSTEPHATANPVHEPAADLAARAAADGVRFLLALFVDLTGKPCAKLVPVEAADELQHEGVGFAGYAVGAIGQQPCDPDLIAIPDPASYTPLPWVREGLALVHCDPHVEGRPWPFAPRVILRQALAAAGALRLYAGAEVEYFLVSRGADGELAPADARDTAAQPCYDARGLTRMYDHLTEVSSAMNTLGWGNYANDHEDGNGQFEQNFAYADALTTADRVITARYLISVLAERRGMTATYMPKPFADRTGSGLHLHLSLWQDDTALFPAGGDGDSGSATFGLSALARSFLAGILDHAPGLQAVIAPTVNSYKRTGATATRSGATGPPTAATTAPTSSGCPTSTGSSCAGQTARPTRTWRWRSRWPPAWTASPVTWTPGRRAATPGRSCRRRCCTPSRPSPPTGWSAGCWTARGRASRSTSAPSSATSSWTGMAALAGGSWTAT